MLAITKKIEIAANLAIIIVAVVPAIVLVQRYLLSLSQPPAQVAPLQSNREQNFHFRISIGKETKITADTAQKARLLSALWQERTKLNNIRLVAVFPQKISETSNI